MTTSTAAPATGAEAASGASHGTGRSGGPARLLRQPWLRRRAALRNRREAEERPVLGRMRLPWRLLGYAAVIGMALLYLLPFLLQVGNSFKTDAAASADPLAVWPTSPTLAAYERLFGIGGNASVPFLRWLGNSVVIAIVVTGGRVFFNALAGYALARLRFRGREVMTACVIGVIAVPGIVLLIPRFLVLKSLGMYDTYAGMVVPLLVDAGGIFLMKQFFESLPREVEEAARIDGAGVFRIFWSIVLPMGKPALITVTILSFQGSWNEFSHYLVAAQSPQYDTLTTGLAGFIATGGAQLGGGNQYPLKLAAAALTTIPVAILFFCLQRHFIRGVNMGSVKE